MTPPLLKRRFGTVDIFSSDRPGHRPCTPGTPLRRCSKCSDIPSSQSSLRDKDDKDKVEEIDNNANKSLNKIFSGQLVSSSSSASPHETINSTNEETSTSHETNYSNNEHEDNSCHSSPSSTWCSTCKSTSSQSIVSSSEQYVQIFNMGKLPSTPNFMPYSKEFKKEKDKHKLSLDALFSDKNNNMTKKEKILKSKSTLPSSSAKTIYRYPGPTSINVQPAIVNPKPKTPDPLKKPTETVRKQPAPQGHAPPLPPPAPKVTPKSPKDKRASVVPPASLKRGSVVPHPSQKRGSAVPHPSQKRGSAAPHPCKPRTSVALPRASLVPVAPAPHPIPEQRVNPAEPAPLLDYPQFPAAPTKPLEVEETKESTKTQPDEGVMVSKDKNGAICFKVPGRVLHKTTIKVTHYPQGGSEIINIDDPFPYIPYQERNGSTDSTQAQQFQTTQHQTQTSKVFGPQESHSQKMPTGQQSNHAKPTQSQQQPSTIPTFPQQEIQAYPVFPTYEHNANQYSGGYGYNNTSYNYYPANQ